MSALQTHRFLMRVALAAVNLFAWIFIFQYFFVRTGDLSHALLACVSVYVLVHLVVLFVTPLSARRLRNGIVAPMTEGVALAAIAYAVLAYAFTGFFGANVTAGIILFALLRGLYHALYWVPYSVDSLRSGQRHPLARFMQEGMLALVPAVAGLILTFGLGGLNLLFLGAATLALISIVPLRHVNDVHEGYSWGYAESFRMLRAKKHHRLVTAAFLDGVSGAALLLFWPIAIFLLVGWSYAMLGLVMSVTYLLVFFMRSYVHGFFKKARIESSAIVHAFLTMSGWILRLVVATPLGVVLVDSYFYTGTQMRGTGISTLTFDQLADHGSYIDEYTTLKEMALALGKITICAIGILCAAVLSLPVTLIIVFLIAAVASGTSVFFSRQKHAHI